MNLGDFSQGQHKNFLPSNPEAVDEALAKLAAKQSKDNAPSLSLLKFIKSAENDNMTLPKPVAIHLEPGNQSKALDAQLFKRFLEFVKSLCDKKCQLECSMFLYPLFVHTYLDLVKRCLTEDAFVLAREYKELFKTNENYVHIVSEVTQIKQYEDVIFSPQIQCLLENKHDLKITEETYAILEGFFNKDINLPFLQFLQYKVHLTVINPHDPNTLLEEEPRSDCNGDYQDMDEPVPDRDTYKLSSEYKQFLDAKIKLDSEPPIPPGLLCWGIHNLEQTSCAKINDKASLLLTGSLNGHINISKLVSPILNTPRSVPINTVPLATPNHQAETFTKPDRRDQKNMPVYGNKGAVYDVAFVPDSKYFLSVSSDHYMRAYSVDTYNCVVKYSGHTMKIWSVDCSPKGYALTASQDTTARLWSLEHLHPLRIFVGHRQDVTCAMFHPNSVYVATSSYDKAVRLWSITDAASVRLFADHDSPVLSVAFSPCGKFIASGGMDGEVIINDLSNCKLISKFNLKQEPVTSLGWSTTGETLAAGSLSGVVSLYAWPSKSKIGLIEGTNIVTYENVFQRLLNIQYKKQTPSPPICLGVPA